MAFIPDTWLKTANRITRSIGFEYRGEKNAERAAPAASWYSLRMERIDVSTLYGSSRSRIERASASLFFFTISQRELRGINGMSPTKSAAGMASTHNIHRQSSTPVPFNKQLDANA